MKKPKSIPLAYFITFTSYGTWLHGGKDKSVNRLNCEPLTPYIPQNTNREAAVKLNMHEPAFILSDEQRVIVLDSIKDVCIHRNWVLITAHVRTNHVHLLVKANTTPEIIMRDVKSYATRSLNLIADVKRNKYWTRHGSTRYLWKSESIYLAMRYVVLEQGKQSAVYKNPNYSLNTSDWT